MAQGSGSDQGALGVIAELSRQRRPTAITLTVRGRRKTTMEAQLKRQLTLAAALALAGALSFAAPGASHAAPLSSASGVVPSLGAAETSQATNVHSRRGYGRYYYRGGRHYGGHVYINPRGYRHGYRYHRRHYYAPRYYGHRYYDNRHYGRRHYRGHGYRHYEIPGPNWGGR